MKHTIKTELKAYVLDLIGDGILTDENKDDWHHHAFNETPYIIGHYQASQWLNEHGLDAFDVIEAVVEYERDLLGQTQITPDKINPETVVNLYVYFLGEALLSDADADDVQELKEFCESE